MKLDKDNENDHAELKSQFLARLMGLFREGKILEVEVHDLVETLNDFVVKGDDEQAENIFNTVMDDTYVPRGDLKKKILQLRSCDNYEQVESIIELLILRNSINLIIFCNLDGNRHYIALGNDCNNWESAQTEVVPEWCKQMPCTLLLREITFTKRVIFALEIISGSVVKDNSNPL